MSQTNNFFEQRWPCLTGQDIANLREFQGYCQEIKSLISAPAAFYHTIYQSTLFRWMEFCQAQPQDLKQPEPYSLLKTSLKTTLAVLKMRRGVMLPPHSNSETIVEQEAAWTFGVFIAGLFARLPDLQSDRTVVLLKSEDEPLGVWHPIAGCLYEPKTYYTIMPKAHPVIIERRIFMAGCLGKILPSPAFRWLSAYPKLWSAWWAVMTDTLDANNVIRVLIEKSLLALSSFPASKDASVKTVDPDKKPEDSKVENIVIEENQMATSKILSDLNAWLIQHHSSSSALYPKKLFKRVEEGMLIRFKGLYRFIEEHPHYESPEQLLQRLSAFFKKSEDQTLILRYGRFVKGDKENNMKVVLLLNDFLDDVLRQMSVEKP